MAVNPSDEVLDYIGAQKTLTMATVGSDGAPHAATLIYVNDGPTLYVWAHSGSTTATQIGDGATVGFAIDEYSEDPGQTKGVQGSGAAAPASGDDIAKIGGLFGDKFPNVRPGA